ncbi:MAG TPA: AAA family ATPase [Actinomycetes bacterium]|nr:AAA family ATPase [Actinomycetes bacterium]
MDRSSARQEITLVGRDSELDYIRELLASVEDAGGALLISGEAGIGKTSVLRETRALASPAGFEVLETTGIEAEAGMPYVGLLQLISPLLPEIDRLPDTQSRAILTALGLQDGPPPQVFMVALATLNLLTEVAANRPVVVLVDDLQWLDSATSETLAFVMRRLGEDPILLVATLRTGHSAGQWRGDTLRELELLGLDESASRDLLQSVAAELEPSEREAILRQAYGNPLALVELPTALQRASLSSRPRSDFLPMSARLERAFAARLPELPQVTRDLLLVAAVDDENDLAEILTAATALRGSRTTLAELEPAAAFNLVSFDERRLRFRHPLVRSAILQAETVTRRQLAHEALAASLRDQSYRRVWHRSKAIVGPDDDLADELETSHVESARRGWVDAAIAALERSADLTTDSTKRGRRLLLAAELSFGLGRADMVDRFVSAAETQALTELDRARVEWLREIFNDGIPGDSVRVKDLCAIARRSAAAGDMDLALNLLLGAALRCWWARTAPDANAAVASVAESLSSARDDPRYLAALAVAEPLHRADEVLRALDSIRVETVTDADALRVLGMAAHAVGDQVRAAEFLDRSERRLREQGRIGLLIHVLGMQGAIWLDLGDWTRTEAASEEGRRLAQDTGQPVWHAGNQVNAARAAGLRGDSTQALALAAEVINAPAQHALTDFLACAQQARGFAYLASGRYDDAFTALVQLFDPGDPSHHSREQLSGLMYLAEAAVRCDRVPEARVVLADMEKVHEEAPSPLLLAHLLYARPVLADDAQAERLFREALAADLSRWPWHRARIQQAYGEWLRRQRRVAESREPLHAALAAYEVIGATAWAAQVRRELRAAGDRVDSGGEAVAELLSPQELQIARLAAQGLSNREIGQQLFLSPRTVGSHLYRIFPKLKITSRAQLASRLMTSAIDPIG